VKIMILRHGRSQFVTKKELVNAIKKVALLTMLRHSYIQTLDQALAIYRHREPSRGHRVVRDLTDPA
jgi:hypothetical protein